MLTIAHVGPADMALVHRSAFLFDRPPTAEHIERFLASSGHHLLVALLDGEPVGFVTGVEMTHPDKGTEMFVYELGTEVAYRRQGVARRLLAELTTIARNDGCYGLWVGTEPDDEPAQASYRSAGFGEPRPATIFERRLT